MVEKTTEEIIDLMKQRGGLALAMHIVQTSPITRTKENYRLLKEMFADFPTGMVDVNTLKKCLEPFLNYEEILFVNFRKVKRNGKVGHQKKFEKGFCYYIVGRDIHDLSKMYVHWREDKRFLFSNIDCLRKQSFYAKKSDIANLPNVYSMTISLYNHEKNDELEGEISLFAGCSDPN